MSTLANPPGLHGTFAQWRDWANSRSPGAGDQFIAWVRANATVPPPYVFNLSSDAYGPTGFGDNNYAENYFGAWLLLGQLGPGIAKALQAGITGGANSIPKALQGFAQAIPKVPGLTGLDAIGGFFATLGQASTWIRVAEVLLGLALIIVGLAKITGAGEIARKAAAVAAKTGLAAA